MAPLLIRHIQRRVRTARDQLTKQVLEVEKVPESMGELTDWCDKNDFYAALARHNDPTDSFCMQHLFPSTGVMTKRIYDKL